MSSGRFIIHADLLVPDATSDGMVDAAVLVEEGRVSAVGPYRTVRAAFPLAEVVAPRVPVLMPGLVDAHSHARSYLPALQDYTGGGPLERFLIEITAWTPVPPGADAHVAAADLAATGVTTVQAIYHSFAAPDRYAADLEAFAAGLASAGVRAVVAAGITDQHEYRTPWTSLDPRGAAVAAEEEPTRGMSPHEFFELFDSVRRDRPPGLERVELILGPVAPQWCSAAVWAGVAARCDGGVRVHTHLLEARSQRAADPFGTLLAAGVVGGRLAAAHAVWLSPAELSLVAAHGATLVHCPSSNELLEVGTAPVRRWLDTGVPVALGLDSNPACSPVCAFTELRAVQAAARRAGEPVSAREALAAATTGGAGAVGRTGDLGRVAVGARADLVALDVDVPPGAEDVVAAVCAAAAREHVLAVWVDGRPVHRRGQPRRRVEALRRSIARTLAADRDRRRDRLERLRATHARAFAGGPGAGGAAMR